MSQIAFDDARLDELQDLLDRTPAPHEALDVSMLDGYLCGVLVQSERPSPARWLPYVTDADGRALPEGFDAVRLHALVQQRFVELDAAIEQRQWFDPWVFELAPPAGAEAQGAGEPRASDDMEAVYPWVAGFALAMNVFPRLMEQPAPAVSEPLALLYRHLDPDDLEDAEQLYEAIAALPELDDLAEAVQDLVRAVLLLADVGRPRPRIAAASRPPRRPSAARRGGPKR
jgi:uncharacterized protein